MKVQYLPKGTIKESIWLYTQRIYELFAKDFFDIMISLFCYCLAKNESSE